LNNIARPATAENIISASYTMRLQYDWLQATMLKDLYTSCKST